MSIRISTKGDSVNQTHPLYVSSSFGTRLGALIADEGLSQRAWAASVGVSPQMVSRYVQGTAIPGADVVSRIVDARPGLSMDWLIRGEGPMHLNDVPQVTARASQGSGEPSGHLTDRLVNIPMLVDIEAAASSPDGGYLVDMDEAVFEPSGTSFPDWFLRSEYGISSERAFFIRARGNSMERTIHPGQRVLCALLPPGLEIRDGLVYICRSPGGILVKRLFVEPDHVHVWSDNPEAPRYRVPLDRWQDEYLPLAVALELHQRL